MKKVGVSYIKFPENLVNNDRPEKHARGERQRPKIVMAIRAWS
jgi:hypothetical protein